MKATSPEAYDAMAQAAQRAWTAKQQPQLAAWLKANEGPLRVVGVWFPHSLRCALGRSVSVSTFQGDLGKRNVQQEPGENIQEFLANVNSGTDLLIV